MTMDTPKLTARKLAGLMLSVLWLFSKWAVLRTLYRLCLIILISVCRIRFTLRVAWFFVLGLARKLTRNAIDALWRVKIREHKASAPVLAVQSPALPEWSKN